MSIKKIGALLLAGALALSFALPAFAQTAAEEREQTPVSESSAGAENAQQEAQTAASSEENANAEPEPQDEAAQSSAQTSEESANGQDSQQ
ncbi:MAG: hypothetical protein ACREQX_15645 [Candidatus Binataceae bacterium]